MCSRKLIIDIYSKFYDMTYTCRKWIFIKYDYILNTKIICIKHFNTSFYKFK